MGSNTGLHRYSYLWQTFMQASDSVRTPHSGGEDQGFADAFTFCKRGLENNKGHEVSQITDQQMLDGIDTIKSLMSTEGIEDPNREGTHLCRARQMTHEEKKEFSRLILKLEHWLDSQRIS